MSDPSFDLVIVGSGAGGLAAAINAKLLGLRPLVLEKTPFIGGSSVMSGGVLWLPNNPLLKREGIEDSREASLRYMENFVGKDDAYSTPARREAFVDNIEEFVTTMEAQGMKYRRCHGYSDCYEHLPGGVAASRSIEAELFNVNRLGEWKARLRPPSFPVPIRTSEAAALMRVGITLDGKIMAARVAGRYVRSKLTGQALYGAGGSLQGRMLEIALKLKCECWTQAGLVDHAGKRFVNEANFERGWVQVDNTITGLAQKCRIDPAGLEATIARYNEMCETGVDTDYGRGGNAYNRYYADPTYNPNPCMGLFRKPLSGRRHCIREMSGPAAVRSPTSVPRSCGPMATSSKACLLRAIVPLRCAVRITWERGRALAPRASLAISQRSRPRAKAF
jgi:hypothetical protein